MTETPYLPIVISIELNTLDGVKHEGYFHANPEEIFSEAMKEVYRNYMIEYYSDKKFNVYLSAVTPENLVTDAHKQFQEIVSECYSEIIINEVEKQNE